MLKIRLSRAWKRNTPFFKVVLTEHTQSAKSWYKEILGFYDPITKEFKIKDLEKVKKYISTWTQFSPRVEKLMKDNNIAL
jgi:small subunit ribosomal protein S16